MVVFVESIVVTDGSDQNVFVPSLCPFFNRSASTWEVAQTSFKHSSRLTYLSRCVVLQRVLVLFAQMLWYRRFLPPCEHIGKEQNFCLFLPFTPNNPPNIGNTFHGRKEEEIRHTLRYLKTLDHFGYNQCWMLNHDLYLSLILTKCSESLNLTFWGWYEWILLRAGIEWKTSKIRYQSIDTLRTFWDFAANILALPLLDYWYTGLPSV